MSVSQGYLTFILGGKGRSLGLPISYRMRVTGIIFQTDPLPNFRMLAVAGMTVGRSDKHGTAIYQPVSKPAPLRSRLGNARA
jgi:hypothetical protein